MSEHKYGSLREKIAAEKAERLARYTEFSALIDRAMAAGEAAGVAYRPTPMVVEQHANQMDDNSPVIDRWNVSEGACGYAWIVVRPGTSSFARWLVKQGIGSKNYYGGVQIWADGFGQSVERKYAYARAFARVLTDAGINAYAQSRMD